MVTARGQRRKREREEREEQATIQVCDKTINWLLAHSPDKTIN